VREHGTSIAALTKEGIRVFGEFEKIEVDFQRYTSDFFKVVKNLA
jgi:hypothetical protein